MQQLPQPLLDSLPQVKQFLQMLPQILQAYAQNQPNPLLTNPITNPIPSQCIKSLIQPITAQITQITQSGNFILPSQVQNLNQLSQTIAKLPQQIQACSVNPANQPAASG